MKEKIEKVNKLINALPITDKEGIRNLMARFARKFVQWKIQNENKD